MVHALPLQAHLLGYSHWLKWYYNSSYVLIGFQLYLNSDPRFSTGGSKSIKSGPCLLPLWIRRCHIMTRHEMSWHMMINDMILSPNVMKCLYLSSKCLYLSSIVTMLFDDMSWCGQSDSERWAVASTIHKTFLRRGVKFSDIRFGYSDIYVNLC